MSMRSHYCGEVNEELLGKIVNVCGWVHRNRDHGGVIFIDMRDRYGPLQVVFDPDRDEIFKQAETLRSECVIRVTGKVRPRPEGTANYKLGSGKIELLAQDLEILNRSETPPIQVDDESVGEDLRLRYRYLDLRRQQMQDNMALRARITRSMRNHLDERGFLDMETPILTRATPEGARDYLVPSRTHPGQFFALPQSPQLFKQLLMMSGFDRYYQIARCFRDEDLRADRQPEFTQLDIEVSFMDEDEIMQLAEGMIRGLFKETLKIDLGDFPRMTYAEAMERFGSDKPDLRVPLELVEVSDLMAGVDFKVFAAPAKDPACRVAAMNVPGGSAMTRKEIDAYTKFVGRYGARGLAYIKVNDVDAGREGLQSPIVKNLPDEALSGLIERLGAKTGDLIFFGADKAKVVNEALGALRVAVGHDRDMLTCEWAPLWVVDFPMFEWDDKEDRWQALHHPFTAPNAASAEELRAQLEADKSGAKALSRAYDMVINGTELGGGSIRIHRADMQSGVFDLLNIGKEEAQEKFGFLLDALQYGAPPHGGLAFGMDRLVMLMTGAKSIREVMAFPKTQSAACPLTQAPGDVSARQLRELNLRLREQPKAPEAGGEANA